MTLNENSEVEEVPKKLDVVGVVKSVSSTMSIRRKSNNESVAKRDITIADE
ncbi:replication protein A 70 kDa DNA-binding subunit, partial [Trifolium pratense]